MKRLLLILILLILPIVSATSIYDFLENVDNSYLIVLGADSPGTDSFVGIDVNSGLSLKLEGKLAEEVTREDKLILIGHPCDNKLIDLSCKNWEYKNGEAIILVKGSNLIISGTSAQDTLNAGKIIKNYKNYNILKDTDKILVTGSGLSKIEQEIKARGIDDYKQEIKEEKVNCDEFCKQNNFVEGICREDGVCKGNEVDKGITYCDNAGCCCVKKLEVYKEEVGFFGKIWKLFGMIVKNLF